MDFHQYEDSQDLFERPPYSVLVRSLQAGFLFVFMLKTTLTWLF